MAFAQALARARFEVLVPDLPGLNSLRVRADDADIIADAISVLSQHRMANGNATVGMIAICYSTGPAMIALLDERIRGAAQFMLSIGGYCDIEAVITFITTGCYRNPSETTRRYRLPDEYGRWVFAISNANLLEDDRDRELLESMARRRLADSRADISDLAAGLGDDGRKIYAVLENRDPDRVSALIAALPRHIVDDIARLDLKRRDFSELDMRFILIHGNDDPVIPETESVALAGALPDADLFILNSMQHVDPGPARLADTLKMLAAMQEFLRERDTARPLKATVTKSPLQLPPGSCRGA
jgi:pimeloyl-ACP methyl ester carboxylesterase